MSAPRRKFILWDNDGVLVDTEQWYYTATRRALGELGVELPPEVYQQIMIKGQSSWSLALQAGIDERQIDAAQARRDSYYQHYLRTEDIRIPGVIEVLAELAEDYDMAIVTTCKRRDFEVIHPNDDILHFMQFVLAREDYVYSKPHPEPYLMALNKFSAPAEQALVIEDSERGLQAARAASIDCVIVDNHFTRGHDFSQAQYRLKTLAELPQLLRAT